MLPVLQIGPLALQTPGLILLLGVWAGLWLAERGAHRHGIEPSHLYNLALVALLSGLVGGRLFYVLSYPTAFSASPPSIFSLNPGLFDVWGALLSGLLVAFLYGNRKKLSFWPALDALTPGLAIVAIALSLSNLASGNAFGAPTQLPWAIELWGAQRHPSQIYEALAALDILAIVLFMQRSDKVKTPGLLFLGFLALSAGARLFLEAFRGDSVLLPNGWRVAQLSAWLLLGACLWLIPRRGRAAREDLHYRPARNTPIVGKKGRQNHEPGRQAYSHHRFSPAHWASPGPGGCQAGVLPSFCTMAAHRSKPKRPTLTSSRPVAAPTSCRPICATWRRSPP
jgi:phosphatidylglycerol---prolipoprotein diacylglyceryl transferase